MKHLLLAFCFSAPALLPAQSAIQKTFELTPAFDAAHVVQASGNGYILWGRQQAVMGGTSDAYYLRLDAQGNQTAYKKYGDADASESIGRSVIPTGNGWITVGAKATPTATKGWILRLGSNGDQMWAKEYSHGGASSTVFHDIAALPGGGYVATGRAGNNLLLAGLSADGNVDWAHTYSTGEGFSLYVSAGGGYCLVAGGDKVWKVRLTNGLLLWEKKITPPAFGSNGQPDNLALSQLIPVSDGRFLTIGSAYADQITSIYSGHYAALWSETGDLIWQKYLQEGASDFNVNEAYSAYYLPNSRQLLVSGVLDGKIKVTRTDLSGKVVETLTLAGQGEFYNPVLIKEGGYYILTAGVLGSSINTFFYRSAGNDLALLAPGNTAVLKTADAARLYPNPATGSAHLAFQAPADATWRFHLLDVAGRVVLEQQAPVFEGFNQIEIGLDGLAPGIYWLHCPQAQWPAQSLVKE